MKDGIGGTRVGQGVGGEELSHGDEQFESIDGDEEDWQFTQNRRGTKTMRNLEAG